MTMVSLSLAQFTVNKTVIYIYPVSMQLNNHIHTVKLGEEDSEEREQHVERTGRSVEQDEKQLS